MEHKSRKMFAAIAVIMLCAVAIIGVGYAYTASTLNNGNTAHSEYVKLSQTGDGKYTFADDARVYYDTTNSSTDGGETNVFKYRLAATTGTISVGDPAVSYTVVKLGDSFNINAEDVYRTSANLSCTFETSGFSVQNTDWHFIIGIKSGTGDEVFKLCDGNDHWDNNTFTIEWDGTSAYKILTVQVYYGCTSEVQTAYTINAPIATPLNEASITFTANVNSSNTAPSA